MQKVGVIGLGYVGLPLAASLANSGLDVLGLDTNYMKIESIKRGYSGFPNEPLLDVMLEEALDGGRLRVTTDSRALANCEAIFICVQTPLTGGRRPDYQFLISACTAIVEAGVTPGALVVVESTLAPGTMTNTVEPLLEEYRLVHAPERLTAGKLIYNLRMLPRVLGTEDDSALQDAVTLYSRICMSGLYPTSWLNAEIVKTAENAYRDVEIAFANEMALICEHYGADVWRIRDLLNTCPGRNMLLPGAGVGGHCLPKDGLLLMHEVFGNGSLIKTARIVNDGMAQHVADAVFRLLPQGGTVTLLGMSYRENTSDTRNAPSERVLNLLRYDESGRYRVKIHDPHVLPVEAAESENYTLTEAAEGSDLLLLMVPHRQYTQLTPHDWNLLGTVMRRKLIYDTRLVLFPPRDAGWEVHRLGVGDAQARESAQC